MQTDHIYLHDRDRRLLYIHKDGWFQAKSIRIALCQWHRPHAYIDNYMFNNTGWWCWIYDKCVLLLKLCLHFSDRWIFRLVKIDRKWLFSAQIDSCFFIFFYCSDSLDLMNNRPNRTCSQIWLENIKASPIYFVICFNSSFSLSAFRCSLSVWLPSF